MSEILRSERYLRWCFSLLLASALVFFFRDFPLIFAHEDHFFHLGNRVTDWQSFIEALTSKTEMWYRPLSNNLACGLLMGLLGNDLRAINFSPLLLHLCNTLLLYGFLDRILSARWAAFLGAFFFLTHHSAQRICVGVAYFPELFMTAFCLLALHLLLSFLKDGKVTVWILLIAALVLGFSSKETALVVPVIVGVAFLLLGPQLSPRQAANRRGLFMLSLGIPTLVYWLFLLHLSPGRFWDYHMTWSVSLALLNLKRVGAVLVLPDQPEGWIGLVLCAGIAVAGFLYRPRISILGMIWILLAIGPMALLSFLSRQPVISWYLYLPAAGLAVLLAAAVDGLGRKHGHPGPKFTRVLIVTFLVLLALYDGVRVLDQSQAQITASSRSKRTYQELLEELGQLPSDHRIYVLKNPARSFAFSTGFGGLFTVASSIPMDNVLYAEAGDELPADFATDPKIHILAILGRGEIIDVTNSFRQGVSVAPKHLILRPDAFEISTGRLVHHQDFLRVRLPDCRNGHLGIRYRVDDGVEEVNKKWFTLDGEGEASYFVQDIKPVEIRITAFQCFYWEAFELDDQHGPFQYRINGREGAWVRSDFLIQISE